MADHSSELPLGDEQAGANPALDVIAWLDHAATRGITQWYMTDTIRVTLDSSGKIVGFYVGHSRAL